MILYQAGDFTQNLLHWAIQAGGRNFLASFGVPTARAHAHRLAGGVTAVEVPEELGRAFLASGREHTVEAFEQFLAGRNPSN